MQRATPSMVPFVAFVLVTASCGGADDAIACYDRCNGNDEDHHIGFRILSEN